MPKPKFNVNDIIEKLNIFIDENEEPLIQEFCLQYGISRSRFYDYAAENKQLSDTIQKAIDKQEIFLIKNTERGKLNPTFVIFRLKQKCFGWKDKQEIDQTVNAEVVTLTQDQKEKKLKELKERLNDIYDKD
ncbi:terminase small subunit [Clostridium brassicae]|uniref:Terminase small subunit n=1 Tax=Clostridium brassicae TaxID=2999072 RepID=A0ABT4D6C0_9CLOT|nr:terminase small subunit [Clostridium brassicae]MCY6957845.1 terminase small subunit [Clostridium brassicae]